MIEWTEKREGYTCNYFEVDGCIFARRVRLENPKVTFTDRDLFAPIDPNDYSWEDK